MQALGLKGDAGTADEGSFWDDYNDLIVEADDQLNAEAEEIHETGGKG